MEDGWWHRELLLIFSLGFTCLLYLCQRVWGKDATKVTKSLRFSIFVN
jgi:hypothetical protein